MKQKQNGAFKIEKGVKVPPPKGGPHGASKYPLAALTPGDSFFVKDGRDVRLISACLGGSIRNHIRNRNPKARFTLRTMDGGVRVWRVE